MGMLQFQVNKFALVNASGRILIKSDLRWKVSNALTSSGQRLQCNLVINVALLRDL